MPDDMYVIHVKYVIFDIFALYGALTYTMCKYFNMDVKRSVMTLENHVKNTKLLFVELNMEILCAIYVNMGVNRSVRTSGMQQTILSMIQHFIILYR